MSIKSAEYKQAKASQGISISLSKKKTTDGEGDTSGFPSKTSDPADLQSHVVAAHNTLPAESVGSTDDDADDEDLSDLEDMDLDDAVDQDDGDLDSEVSLERRTAEDIIANDDSLDLDSDTVDNGLVMIYNANCLGCGHLVPHVKHKFKSCHFSKGNTQCPASSVQILIDIDLEPIVTAFVASKREGDNKRLARLYTQLASKPEWQQNRITTAVEKREAELKSTKKKK
jgi:hypothetical protein